MPKIRVLIIDDAVVVRRLVADCLAADPEIEVVGTAANGQIGLAKIDQVNPDLVTLDIEMPVMDGFQTLAQIRKVRPTLPVVMFSTLTERGAASTIDALSLGASDYITKPADAGSISAALQRVRDELIPKIKTLCRRPSATVATPAKPARAFQPAPAASSRVEILAIGVSTGGPTALAVLLPLLQRPFPVPIVIVQHMPPLFTRLLGERLSSVSGHRVREGEAGALLKDADAWIAPGGFHMELQRSPAGVALTTNQNPPENSCRPAVDVLFRSVAQMYGTRSLGIILTGMGQDGLRGCEHIREAGGQVLAQDEASSVVWGMPRAVAQAGLAQKVLPLTELAAEINQRVRAAATGFKNNFTVFPTHTAVSTT